MAKFVTSKDTQLDINGVQFELDSTDLALLERLEKFSTKTEEIEKQMKDRTDYVQAVRETTEFVAEAIDSFLGDGACVEIFKDQPISLVKGLDVIEYITSELRTNRTLSMGKYSPNREVRRTKTTTKKK